MRSALRLEEIAPVLVAELTVRLLDRRVRWPHWKRVCEAARERISSCLPKIIRRETRLRVLVVRLGAMGDVLHAMPAVAALRARLPECHIGWVIEPRWAPLASREWRRSGLARDAAGGCRAHGECARMGAAAAGGFDVECHARTAA